MRVFSVPFMGALAAVLCIAMPAFAEDPIRPDPKLTPGAGRRIRGYGRRVCQRGYARSACHVHGKTRAMVYREYGLRRLQGGAYEIDHLISLELGGFHDIRNLWPEIFDTEPLNIHVKDKLEDRLHKLVCHGSLSLREAQAAIASDRITQAQIRKSGPRLLLTCTRRMPTRQSAFYKCRLLVALALSAVLPICSGYAISSTLSTADPSSRRRRRRAAVQLNLAFLDPPDLPADPLPPSLAPIPWEQLDEAARTAALEIIARLIARMLVAAANGASHE